MVIDQMIEEEHIDSLIVRVFRKHGYSRSILIDNVKVKLRRSGVLRWLCLD